MKFKDKLLPDNKRYFIRPGATDMRKSIGTLSALIEIETEISPFSQDYFLFSNRRKNIIKILYWHLNGFCVLMKKLEQERFPWPDSQEDLKELSEERIIWLLSGIDARKEHQRLNYSKTG